MAEGLKVTSPEVRAGLAPERVFLAASAFLFLACVGGTIYLSQSKPASMPLPGGVTLSMAWVPMPGQTWPTAAAAFLGMWMVMMAAMMLPTLVPMLLGYRRALRRQGVTRLGGPTVLAGAGYFSVWAVLGVVVYGPGALLAAAEAQSMTLASLAPFATGVIFLAAGCLQLTAWKAHQLSCAPQPPAQAQGLAPDARLARSAWRYGLRLGQHCSLCCSGLMLVLLATGVMDLGMMAAVAAAITLEQLAPAPLRFARATGVIAILAGIFVLVRTFS